MAGPAHTQEPRGLPVRAKGALRTLGLRRTAGRHDSHSPILQPFDENVRLSEEPRPMFWAGLRILTLARPVIPVADAFTDLLCGGVLVSLHILAQRVFAGEPQLESERMPLDKQHLREASVKTLEHHALQRRLLRLPLGNESSEAVEVRAHVLKSLPVAGRPSI